MGDWGGLPILVHDGFLPLCQFLRALSSEILEMQPGRGLHIEGQQRMCQSLVIGRHQDCYDSMELD